MEDFDHYLCDPYDYKLKARVNCEYNILLCICNICIGTRSLELVLVW